MHAVITKNVEQLARTHEYGVATFLFCFKIHMFM